MSPSVFMEIPASELSERKIAGKRQRDQLLRLVARGFYNELTNYGVRKEEILRVASHLLDNLMSQHPQPDGEMEYYNRLFTLNTVENNWAARKELIVRQVTLRPLQLGVIEKIAAWLKEPSVRENFVPAFPEKTFELQKYFTHPTREYFGIYYNGQPVGIIGAENIDPIAGKVEMKKLVGEPDLQGKDIGKHATFGFLFYIFVIRNLNKVYIHSRDINIHNINLNSRFGFELEGVFFDDIKIAGRHQDVLRMALFKTPWLKIFSA